MLSTLFDRYRRGAGRAIALSRRFFGLSQTQLGARLGVSRTSVMRWETGRTYPDSGHVRALDLVFADLRRKKNQEKEKEK